MKWRWKLSIDQAEKNAISATMKNCTTASLKVAGLTRAKISSDTTPPATTTPPSGTTPAGDDPRYRYCTEAKAAGYGPYLRGIDPEYSWYRDGDSDGIVCE